MSFFSRFVNVFRDRRVQRELDEELRFHVEARADDLMREGLAPHEARARAARQLGVPLRWREASRDVKLLPWLDSLLRDVRFGLRMLARHATVSTAAVLSLALALGAVTAAFSLIDALIVRPLPVAAPDQLYAVEWTQPGSGDVTAPAGAVRRSFSYPLYQRLRDAAGSDAELFATTGTNQQDVTFAAAPDDVERVNVGWVTGNAMPALGLQPALGRLLTPADDRQPGQHPVATISHSLWTRRFAQSPAVLGQWLTIGGLITLQIVGVMPAGFTGVEPGARTDLWMPTMMAPHTDAFRRDQFNWLQVMARVPDEASAASVRERLAASFTAFRRDLAPRTFRADEPPSTVARFLAARLLLQPAANGSSALRRDLERPLWILALVAGLVLLIACSNVANLMMARAAAREREMALRVSLGAGRARLVQQVLIESALLALIASALGLLIARAAAPLIVALLAPSDNPAYLDLRIDWRVIGFAALCGALTTALFGLAPAWRARRVAPQDVLKAAGSRQSGSARMFRPLIALQIGISVTVLFICGLFLLSFQRLAHVDPGLNAENLLLFTIKVDDQAAAANQGSAQASARAASPTAPAASSNAPRLRALAFTPQIRQALTGLSRIDAVSLSAWNHFVGGGWTSGVRVPGRPADRVENVHLEVSPGFVDTLQIGLVAGRDFEPRDSEPVEPTAVIVNEAFARHYFPGEVPIGRRYMRLGGESTVVPQEIVGVMRDAKYMDLRETPPPTVYLPLGLNGRRLGGSGALQLRTTLPMSAAVPLVRDVLTRVHPALRVVNVTTQSTLIGNTMLRERLLALLSGFFAVVALLLAGVGLYGVLSYAVIQRTREIGIRLALGARRARIVRAVLFDIAVIVSIGLAAGLGVGLLLSGWVSALLFEVYPSDAGSIVWPAAGLFVVALIAVLPPAWRATRVDPLIALRAE